MMRFSWERMPEHLGTLTFVDFRGLEREKISGELSAKTGIE